MSKNRKRRPRVTQGQPEHGSSWDEGVVLRAKSRGAGVPIEVRPPRAGAPLRVVSGDAQVQMRGGKLFVTPNNANEGDDLSVVVEY